MRVGVGGALRAAKPLEPPTRPTRPPEREEGGVGRLKGSPAKHLNIEPQNLCYFHSQL